jgi:hypothetical protein
LQAFEPVRHLARFYRRCDAIVAPPIHRRHPSRPTDEQRSPSGHGVDRDQFNPSAAI